MIFSHSQINPTIVCVTHTWRTCLFLMHLWKIKTKSCHPVWMGFCGLNSLGSEFSKLAILNRPSQRRDELLHENYKYQQSGAAGSVTPSTASRTLGQQKKVRLQDLQALLRSSTINHSMFVLNKQQNKNSESLASSTIYSAQEVGGMAENRKSGFVETKNARFTRSRRLAGEK